MTEDLDASRQRSEEKEKSGKRKYWPVVLQLFSSSSNIYFQLFSPIVLKSLVGGKHSENKENIDKEEKERKVDYWGGKFVRLNKRQTWPNTFKLANPIWRIRLAKWLSKENAKTIQIDQEPTSYLSFCCVLSFIASFNQSIFINMASNP